MAAGGQARILCVDDEPNVLRGLRLHLRHHVDVETATGGVEALAILAERGPFEAIVSDMRMPGMSGARLLARVRQDWPDTVRLLLTGASDLESAIAAVNEGQVFRFLTKPCPPEVLIPAVADAVRQYRLVTAERVLLEQTLHGCVMAVTDILAIAQPASFSRATRAKRHLSDMADFLGLSSGRWEIEVAAMLSQIGCVTLPPETVDRWYEGLALSEQEQRLVDRHPLVGEKLLANIPRLEGVREIVRYQDRLFSGSGLPPNERRGEDLPLGARLLKLILDFDALESAGVPEAVAFDTLRGRHGWYDPALLEAFARLRGNLKGTAAVREVKVSGLAAGMILATDVHTHSGSLLVARGHEVTAGLLERIRNFHTAQGVREPIRVTEPSSVESQPLVTAS